MKVLTAVLATVFVLVGSMAMASPFIVCDVPPAGENVTFYKVTGPAWVPTSNITAQTDGSIKWDVAAAPVGTSNLGFRACNMWGTIENCSTSSPFPLVRPSLPSAPSGTRLVP
jgi:hypothetical protein